VSRSAKQGDSPSGSCREVYPVRSKPDVPRELELQAEFEHRIRVREIAAERARVTWGVGMDDDPTGFCPGCVI
jgi:hypothetical protein